MKDVMESMRNDYHLQRIPSCSGRDEGAALLSRGPVEDTDDLKCPSTYHLTSISFVVGELETPTGLSSLRMPLKIILIKCTFMLTESSAGNSSSL